jgi:drug/metabolite transporter (DMT)-like permease
MPSIPMSKNLQGMLLVLGSTLFLASMAAMVRHLSDSVPPMQAAFFRNFIGLLILLPTLFKYGPSLLKTDNLGFMALRGVFNAGAMITYFLAITMIPLAEVAALNFTVPLFVSLLAVLILKERMGMRRTLSLVIGFSGALIIIRPGVEIVHVGAIFALTSAITWAFAVIVIKHLTVTNSSLTITFYGVLFLTIFTLPPALYDWVWPKPEDYLWLAALAGAGTIGQLMFAQGMRSADATLVMPFDFAKLIWASLFGFIFFSQVPTIWTFAGGALIFAGATYLTYREGRDKRQAEATPDPV